jgi:hypothetical protein
VTKRLEIDAMRRPRRRIGEMLRFAVCCPVCAPKQVETFNSGKPKLGHHGSIVHSRIIAWRRYNIRFECENCGLRFSVDRDGLQASLEHNGGYQ